MNKDRIDENAMQAGDTNYIQQSKAHKVDQDSWIYASNKTLAAVDFMSSNYRETFLFLGCFMVILFGCVLMGYCVYDVCTRVELFSSCGIHKPRHLTFVNGRCENYIRRLAEHKTVQGNIACALNNTAALSAMTGNLLGIAGAGIINIGNNDPPPASVSSNISTDDDEDGEDGEVVHNV